jgi:hypothetical protein
MWIVTALLCGIVALSTGLAWATTRPPQRAQVVHRTAMPSPSAQRMQATATPAQRAQVAGGVAAPYLGLVNMGMPAAPQAYMPSDFAITKHQRQTCGGVIDNGYGPPADGGTCSMTADHGTACQPPPTSHSIDTAYANEVFVCHDHLMTAFDPAGAGVIQLQPAQLVDISGGAVTVSVNRSTAITTPNESRDYTQLYFVPFAQQLAYNTDENIGEQMKEPSTYLRVNMRTQGGNTFAIRERVAGVDYAVPGDNYQTLEQATGLVDSATVRTPITVTFSATHVRLVSNSFTFYDAELPVPLPASQFVMQIQHVSYHPEKESGRPDTWHWSNLAISRAVPYYLNMAMPAAVGDYSWLGQRVTFAPAPSGAFLRFQGFNAAYDFFARGYQISFDNGATWQAWANQTPQDKSLASVLQPIPVGATSAILRGPGGWYARDFYVMSLSSARASLAAPTAMRMSPAPAAPLPPIRDPSTVIIASATRVGVWRRGGLLS